MITNKQKWVLGGLVTLSAAIWTPQVLERVGGGTSSQVALDAGPNEEEMLSIEMESTGQLPGPSGSVSQAVPGGGSTGFVSAPTEGLSIADGQLAPGGSTAIVSEVLRTLRQTEAFSVDNELEEVVEEPEAMELEEEAAPELPSLMLFLQENPLRGTLVGDTTQMALIGKNRVHLGEVVPGTGAVLTAVKRGHATLTEGSMVVELTLKPLETSEELMNARSQAQGAGASTGPVESDLPDPEAIPGPTEDAQVSPSAELPGSTGDF